MRFPTVAGSHSHSAPEQQQSEVMMCNLALVCWRWVFHLGRAQSTSGLLSSSQCVWGLVFFTPKQNTILLKRRVGFHPLTAMAIYLAVANTRVDSAPST